MLIEAYQKLRNSDLCLTLYGETLSCVAKTKYLGFIIDKYLTGILCLLSIHTSHTRTAHCVVRRVDFRIAPVFFCKIISSVIGSANLLVLLVSLRYSLSG